MSKISAIFAYVTKCCCEVAASNMCVSFKHRKCDVNLQLSWWWGGGVAGNSKGLTCLFILPVQRQELKTVSCEQELTYKTSCKPQLLINISF
jgi:hypothetical protein